MFLVGKTGMPGYLMNCITRPGRKWHKHFISDRPIPHKEGLFMPSGTIAMLNVDHHIHMIPVGRVQQLSIEHSAIKKIENEKFEFACILRLSVEGEAHPLEDVIRLTFAAARLPGSQMMTELTFIQNHIIKEIFDWALSGELSACSSDDPLAKECGIALSSVIIREMLASKTLKDVLERHGALPESMTMTH